MSEPPTICHEAFHPLELVRRAMSVQWMPGLLLDKEVPVVSICKYVTLLFYEKSLQHDVKYELQHIALNILVFQLLIKKIF